MKQTTDSITFTPPANAESLDPIEERLRSNVRSMIEAVFEEELDSFLGRLRYRRGCGAVKGYRHGHRDRRITGTFGTETVSVPRARVEDREGKAVEWRSRALPRYRRLTKTAEATVASIYLSGTNTRRVKRALFALSGEPSARMWPSGPGAGSGPIGKPGAPATWRGRTSSGPSWTVPS